MIIRRSLYPIFEAKKWGASYIHVHVILLYRSEKSSNNRGIGRGHVLYVTWQSAGIRIRVKGLIKSVGYMRVCVKKLTG